MLIGYHALKRNVPCVPSLSPAPAAGGSGRAGRASAHSCRAPAPARTQPLAAGRLARAPGPLPALPCGMHPHWPGGAAAAASRITCLGPRPEAAGFRPAAVIVAARSSATEPPLLPGGHARACQRRSAAPGSRARKQAPAPRPAPRHWHARAAPARRLDLSSTRYPGQQAARAARRRLPPPPTLSTRTPPALCSRRTPGSARPPPARPPAGHPAGRRAYSASTVQRFSSISSRST
jgi:hypothetical protein